MAEMQSIKSAPRDGTVLEIETSGGYRMLAFFDGGLVGDDGQEAFGWHAVLENSHPDCWDDGVCWASNAAGVPSDPPVRWREANPTTSVSDTDRDAIAAGQTDQVEAILDRLGSDAYL